MNLAQMIDHTNLKPDATLADIDILCQEADESGFAAVCVNPIYVQRASNKLMMTDVEIATVVGFPLGNTDTQIKAYEAELALDHGATEIDMVMNIGLFKSKEYYAVEKDISEIVAICQDEAVKVILETCLLSPDEIALASKIAMQAGATYIKTSTGFSSHGATVDVVHIMKETVGDYCKIKASGGIRTRDDALNMIDAGAMRIGTSSGVAILKG